MTLLSISNFPKKFKLKEGHDSRLVCRFQFDCLNIRTILYYSAYIGIKDYCQREFSLIFLRQLPIFKTPKGCIEYNIYTNRLTVYIRGYKPIGIIDIEESNIIEDAKSIKKQS